MSNYKSGRFCYARLPLVAAMLGCLYGAAAMAQTDTDQDAEEAEAQDRVTVTGSLIRRDEYTSASPLTVITADTKITEGLVDAADFLQTSSIAAGSTQINHQFGGFVTQGGLGVQTISLRGLGAQRTLVLLNNNRPGPAGVRGQVAAFDLNVLPTTIIQRAEILKDGASSIYGSDAVAGVVNVITRTDIDSPEFQISGNLPFEGGGERFSASGATGWQFDSGSIAVAGEWYLHRPLKTGDRDFLRCSQPRVFDGQGNRIDREDRSINAGTRNEGCAWAIHNAFDEIAGGAIVNRYVPSPDGVTVGLVPGYRPDQLGTYADGGQAFHEQVLYSDFNDREHIINRQERFSLYARADFNFGAVDWDAEALYNRRKTDNLFIRQFFPIIAPGAYADNPDYFVPFEPGTLARPIMPFTWQDEVEVDFYYLSTGLEGSLGRDWFWNAQTSYSYSDGDYTRPDSIVVSRTGDIGEALWDGTAPRVNYFEPCILSGECMDQLAAAISQSHTGNTTYDQFVLKGVIGGDLFDLPAGPVGLAVGSEYRRFSIDDTPSDLTLSGELWGETQAQRTKGNDNVIEGFAEIDVPLIAGTPGFESLTFSASARAFNYDSVSGSDYVWKTGLNWQIVPSTRLRATYGTSYRAPGLFELFLGGQTGFLSQTAVDPCVRWGESSNEFIRANCEAVGIPDDYAGVGSSATIIAQGGEGFLEPETSKAFTAGIVLTPTWANLNIAIDYFEFRIKDEIAQFGAANITASCYTAPVFPNAFCDLIDRFDPDHPSRPNQINSIENEYRNINLQENRGFDINFRYDRDFAFGSLEVEGEGTYTFKAERQIFGVSAGGDGFTSSDLLGLVGRPKWVGGLRTALKRGDFTYTWFMDYVGRTKNDERVTNEVFTYQNFPGARRDVRAGRRIYQGFSVLYDHSDNWSILAGVRNILDADPPRLSQGAGSSLYGNVPAFATQYDLYGRTGYLRFNYRF